MPSDLPKVSHLACHWHFKEASSLSMTMSHLSSAPCPEKLQVSHPWKCSRLDWVGIWAVWLSGRCYCWWAEGLELLVPSQPKTFYDSKSTSSNGKTREDGSAVDESRWDMAKPLGPCTLGFSASHPARDSKQLQCSYTKINTKFTEPGV